MSRNAVARINVSGLLTLAAVLGLWQATIAFGVVDLDYLPEPTAIASAAAADLNGLLDASLHTLTAALTAWVIALLVGVSAGMVLGVWPPAQRLFAASIDVFRTLPVVAFVPVAVLLYGLSTKMEIAVATWSALWPILVNTVGGVQAVHPRLYEVAAVMRMSRLRRMAAIVLPAAAPLILVGARLGLALALIVTVAAEMIGNPAGLGYTIVQMQQALRPDAMFAAVLACGLLGVGLNFVLLTSAARIAPGVFDQGRRP
jgi:ABC-type nitrate/sulfonate/bicarbonate transport system permease component